MQGIPAWNNILQKIPGHNFISCIEYLLKIIFYGQSLGRILFCAGNPCWKSYSADNSCIKFIQYRESLLWTIFCKQILDRILFVQGIFAQNHILKTSIEQNFIPHRESLSKSNSADYSHGQNFIPLYIPIVFKVIFCRKFPCRIYSVQGIPA